eukprot:1061393_1
MSHRSQQVSIKTLLMFVIAMGLILVILLQDYTINLPEHNDMNTWQQSTADITRHRMTEELNKSYKTFASFIGIPNFYIKYGHYSASPNHNLLTICSFCSLDILFEARTLATNYRSGPLSIAVYIDEDITHHTIANKTVLHHTIEEYFHNISTPYDVTIGLLYINKSSRFWRHLPITSETTMDWKLPYNALRNLAEHQVNTKWLMNVDIDFELYSSTIHNGIDTILTNASAYSSSNHTIFIVPAFAMNASYIEDSTTDYNNLTRAQLTSFIPHQILPFQYNIAKHNILIYQRCTAYSQWYKTETDYVIDSTRCSTEYEPYYIINTAISREYAWDSRFVGRHLDKIQRMQLLRYLEFTAIVLRDMFMIHVNQPHQHITSKRKEIHQRKPNWCLLTQAKYYHGEPHCMPRNITRRERNLRRRDKLYKKRKKRYYEELEKEKEAPEWFRSKKSNRIANINASTLSEFDLRHPALKYTIDVATESNIDLETARKQQQSKDIFVAAKENAKKKSERKQRSSLVSID